MSKLSKQSVFSNLEYRHTLLKKEVEDLVISLLPEEGRVDCEFQDNAGNEVYSLSRERVYADDGHTDYSFDELTIADLLQVASALIHELND